MYADHVPLINEAMRASAETFARGVMFAALSARQPIQGVPDALRDVDRNGGEAEALALPTKWECWNYLEENAADLWRVVCAFPSNETEAALKYLAANVPGLGIIKGAFVLQFLGHDIGCLDTHNMRREGIPPRAFRHAGPGRGYERQQFARYLKLAAGRARELWDTWCEQLGPMRDMTAQQISELHLAILPDGGRAFMAAEIPF